MSTIVVTLTPASQASGKVNLSKLSLERSYMQTSTPSQTLADF